MTSLMDDGTAEPGTHVLIVGVGSYPYLKGGSAPEAERFAHHSNMGQLSSPPQSVVELVRWFIEPGLGFFNPERPLRSLSALCSAPAPVAVPGLPVFDPATSGNVHQAIRDFKARASSNEENLALFYFCGHGLAFSEVQNSLLLEDFGKDADDPMTAAIAFDQLRQGLMQKCDARYQVHFVDACRTRPTPEFTAAHGDMNSGAAVVAGGGISRKLREKVSPVFFATGLAAPAYGLPNQASLFTQGLLRCFRGVGSRDADDHWEITVPAVAEGINKSVQSLAFEMQPQFCQPRDTGQSLVLHHVRGEPEVIVKVFTRDEALLPTAVLAHVDENAQRVERPPSGMPWWVSVPSGKYRFEALSGGNVIATRNKHVAPPSAEVGL